MYGLCNLWVCCLEVWQSLAEGPGGPYTFRESDEFGQLEKKLSDKLAQLEAASANTAKAAKAAEEKAAAEARQAKAMEERQLLEKQAAERRLTLEAQAAEKRAAEEAQRKAEEGAAQAAEEKANAEIEASVRRALEDTFVLFDRPYTANSPMPLLLRNGLPTLWIVTPPKSSRGKPGSGLAAFKLGTVLWCPYCCFGGLRHSGPVRHRDNRQSPRRNLRGRHPCAFPFARHLCRDLCESNSPSTLPHIVEVHLVGAGALAAATP